MHPVYVDLDDVLADSTRAYLEILAREFGRVVAYRDIRHFDLRISFGLDGTEFNAFFQRIHHPDEVLAYPAVTGAAATLTRWAAAGMEIAIVTGRQPAAYEASLEWLRRRRIPYDSFTIVDKYHHPEMAGPLTLSLEEWMSRPYSFAVEDSVKMARILTERKATPVALFNRPWNRDAQLDPAVTRHDDWAAIDARFRNAITDRR